MASQSSEKRALMMWFAGACVLLVYGLIVDPDTGSGGVPCLWKSLFGLDCPGCGLSRAGALLLHGRVHEAASRNWLIFPFGIVFVWKFVNRVSYISKTELPRRNQPWLR